MYLGEACPLCTERECEENVGIEVPLSFSWGRLNSEGEKRENEGERKDGAFEK